ncbi:MAG: glucodextranase DOMON-like domain-containing protein [Pyrobaculum sp.]|uniref:glucodextranase DOMON-like domain-containing protein n=1 Tax=Pyrobaculum sp. TaxID=2004705 RepID=UPI003175593D
MKSKEVLLAVMLAALIYAQGVFTVQTATDPTGDFKGPGWFIPPQNPVFKNGTVFDLTKFEVLYNATADALVFRLTFADLGGNPWGSETGSSLQYVQIYISRGFPGNPWGTVSCTILRPDDGDVASGNAFFDEATRFFCPDPANLTQFKYTPGVKFSSQAPWDVAIFIGPKWGNETVNFVAVADVTGGTISVSPLLRVYAQGNAIVAVVPRKLIPPTTRLMSDFPQPSWRYYVLVTSYDGFGPGRIRPFGPMAQEWTVGVGTANASAVLSGTIPRVLDILGTNTPLRTFTKDTPAALEPQTPSWGNFPLAYTTTTVNRIVPLTVTKTDTLTLTETTYITMTTTRVETSTKVQTFTQVNVVEKPYVDPVSYAVLGIGVIAGIVGALAAARRK